MPKKIDLVIAQNYLSPFAALHNPRLSPELVDYLSTEAYYYEDLQLEISCPAADQERLEQAISNTFEQMTVHLKGDMRMLRVQAICLLALSFALVMTSTTLNIEGTISLGMVTIVAWMMVWRAAEIMLLDLRAAKRDVRKYRRIIDAPKQFI